jgi:hypothetical protein
MRALGWMGLAAILVVGCGSEINVFQTSTGTGGEGTGAAGGGATTTTNAGGAGAATATTSVSVGGQGGNPGECVDDTPCLVDAVCLEGYCDLSSNTCDVVPFPAGTSCGTGASCDGNGNCATGDVEWAKTFGDGNDQRAHEVAADSQGNAIITGYYLGNIDFGGGNHNSGGSQDAYLAKFDPSGTLLWSHAFPGAQQDWGWDVVIDASDNVILAGYFYGQINLGAGLMTSVGQRDIFVAKFSPAGTLLWANQYGGTAEELPRTVAVGPSGEIVVGGYWYVGNVAGSTMVLGSTTYNNAGNLDVFVAKLDENGNHLWSKSAGNAAEQRLFDVVIDATGAVVVSGFFGGSIDFGGGTLTSAGQVDAFVAKFSASGAHMWSEQYGDGASQLIRGLAIDGANEIVMAGYTDGAIDLGGGPLVATGAFDMFVARLDATGAHLASKMFMGNDDEYSRDLAIDAAGNVVIGGGASGSPDFGGGSLTTLGGDDAFVLKLTPDFTHLWSRVFGAANTQVAHGVAVDPGGAVFVAGYFGTAIDFGMGPVASAGQADAFLAKFSP